MTSKPTSACLLEARSNYGKQQADVFFTVLVYLQLEIYLTASVFSALKIKTVWAEGVACSFKMHKALGSLSSTIFTRGNR